jgi:GntR family carbon starvation induced transcriptional regulator
MKGVDPDDLHESAVAALSRTDWAVDRIRRAVIFGDIKAGERLTSSAWGTKLKVSQTPLREAFQRLVAEGLLTYDSARGARVATTSLRELTELYELRVDLEPRAVSDSVLHGDDKWRDQLTHAYTTLKAAVSDEAVLRERGHIATHLTFHSVLRSRCTSRWLLRFAEQLADHSVRFAFTSLSTPRGRRTSSEEHEAMFHAAIAGNAKECGRLARRHMHLWRDAARAALHREQSEKP